VCVCVCSKGGGRRSEAHGVDHFAVEGARDDAGKLLMVRGQLSSHPVFDKK